MSRLMAVPSGAQEPRLDRIFRGHGAQVSALAFCADSTLLYSGAADGNILVCVIPVLKKTVQQPGASSFFLLTWGRFYRNGAFGPIKGLSATRGTRC